jgi:hypothetical protein
MRVIYHPEFSPDILAGHYIQTGDQHGRAKEGF